MSYMKHTPDPSKQWFVLRATYNRQQKAYDYIVNSSSHADAEVYLPLHHVLKCINGRRKRVLEPYLPQLLFVYATAESVKQLVENTPDLSFLTYYYNHFRKDEHGKNPPLTVPYCEMMNFIRLTSIDNEHIRLVNPEQCHYKSGDLVKVIEGEFTGIEGRVARVAGQQRVVVELSGICLITTAYIPSAFIQRI